MFVSYVCFLIPDEQETKFEKEIDQDVTPASKPADVSKVQTLPPTRSPRLPKAPIENSADHNDKSKGKSQTLGPTSSLAPKSPKPQPKAKPIKIENLPDYIAKKKVNRSEGFKTEFEVS